MKFKSTENKCDFCGRKMEVSHRQYLANSFCGECYEDRLEASSAIDLRDNYKIIDHGDGYCTIVPIDETKKYKKK